MTLSQEIAFEKLKKYCAYQDRCHSEVRTKLISIKIYGDDLEEIITELIKENFLNEERYARSYCRGKFRIKRWGKNKIKLNLYKKRVSEYCIRKGLEEIDEEEYIQTLEQLVDKTILKYDDLSDVLKIDKTIKYVMSRGYEPPLIYNYIKVIENRN